MAVDTNFADDIRNNLFKSFGSSEGGDLFAINIQRGREHGIGSYLEVRRWCRNNGYGDEVNFRQGMQDLLEEEYAHVEDIDLYVGGLAEAPMDGGVVGPTFGCIFAEQFKRLKSANKYFYTNSNVYSQAQLDEVRKLDLAAVLCAAGQDTTTVPKDPFFLESENNKMVNCDDIDMPDFSVWASRNAVKKALFSCAFDESRSMLDCSNKNWSELMYLTEAANVSRSLPARTTSSGERSIDFDANSKVGLSYLCHKIKLHHGP